MFSSLKSNKSVWDDISGKSLVGWGLPLQLQRRGNFFSDSLFHDTRSHFDLAVKDILRDFDLSQRDNDFASYRLLRDRHLTGSDRAGSVTEETDNFKVVLDVHGFIENDLKVTFLNDNELIVEGQIEKKDKVSFAKQSFKRRFLLPSKVIVKDATSGLSTDNILTITIPKQLQSSVCGREETDQVTINQNTNLTSSQSEESKASISSELSSQFQKEESLSSFNTQNKDESLIQSSLDSFKDLPITPRDEFFTDSFFDNVRNQFQSRVKEIMDKKFSRRNEDFNFYRTLRVKDDKENNVAVTVSGDSKEHKIVLDVHGFSEGDLKVKAVSESELIVEGRVEKKTDNSFCNNSFRRSFCLADVADIHKTTSALSSDGVLTIIVPKKQQRLPIEYSVPISREEKIKEAMKTQATSKTESSSVASREHIVPIALGYKDDFSSIDQEQKKENVQTQASVVSKSHDAQTTHRELHSDCRMIPISLGGSFFDDSIFEAAKQRVETAVKDAMSRTVTQSSSSQQQQHEQQQHEQQQQKQQHEQQQQQQQQLQQQLQTSTVTQDVPKPFSSTQKYFISSNFVDKEHIFKINLDLFGYKENELKIKVLEHNEILIEGLSESQKEGSSSRQSFQKTFQLPPSVLVQEATSALSSEGMLTITMPKKIEPPVAPGHNIIPVTLEGHPPAITEPLSHSDIESCRASTLSNISDIESCGASTLSQQSSVVSQQESQDSKREFVVPVSLESANSSTSTVLQSEAKTDDLQSKIQVKSDDILSQRSNFEQDFFKDVATRSSLDLPIARRGHFYQDSFFNDSRDMFESALRNTMSRFKSFSSFSDDMNFYKSLRDQRAAAETPTEISGEDQQFHKIVLDVQGYSEGDLKIQTLEGNGILVEGKVEERSEGSTSKRSFSKRFFLPTGFNVQGATTGLSSDGVLSIKVPRSNTAAISF